MHAIRYFEFDRNHNAVIVEALASFDEGTRLNEEQLSALRPFIINAVNQKAADLNSLAERVRIVKSGDRSRGVSKSFRQPSQSSD